MKTHDLSTLTVEGATSIEILPGGGLIPTRMPLHREALPPTFARFTDTGAGIRLGFRTAAPSLEMRLRWRGNHRPWEPPTEAAIDLVVDGLLRESRQLGAGEVIEMDARGNVLESSPAVTTSVVFSSLSGDISTNQYLWLPTNAHIVIESIECDSDLLPPLPITRPRWIHYGSSISQCADAGHPTAAWPAAVAISESLDLTCLGYAGQCQIDPFVASTIRDLPDVDLVTLKVGINVWGARTLTKRTFGPVLHGFIDTVRRGQPTASIAVISPIACPAAEHSVGPVSRDPVSGVVRAAAETGCPTGEDLTLGEIRDEVRDVVERRVEKGDGSLSYFDGTSLLGDQEAGLLRDGIHPSPEGYDLIARRFVETILPVALPR